MKHTYRLSVTLLLVAGILFLCLPHLDVIAAELQAYTFNTLELMSVNGGGTKSNSAIDSVSVNTDGQYVAFDTVATTLVAGTTNGYRDVFVKDRITGAVERVSISNAGGQGNNHSMLPSISGDGRYVAFLSMATNLVAGDTNGQQDIFVYDRDTNTIALASVAEDGTQANGASQNPRMCGNGSHVVFESYATNLVGSDTNGMADIFIKNLSTGAVELVSTATGGAQANNASFLPAVSADCRYIVFKTQASNLAAVDTNNRYDIFIKDRTTGTTTRVSDTAGGSESNNHSDRPAVSNDGQVVTFASNATNFVAGDNNSGTDVYVKNLQTGTVTLASAATNGSSNNGFSTYPSISGDGRYVAFYSSSTDLVADDTNGTWDIFVFDLNDSSTVMVSKTESDGLANGPSYDPKISNGGTSVAFVSSASNLLSSDADDTGDAYLISYIVPQLAAPTLALPEDDSSSYDATPTFDWDDVVDATGYTLQYSTDEAFSSSTEETVAESTFTPSSELSVGEWFWRVKATGDAPESEWSAIWSFTVEELDAPTLVSPTDVSTTQNGLYPTFHWSAVTGATGYELEYSPDDTFASSSTESSSTTSVSLDELGLGTWYWRVKASNALDESPWSEVWSFTIEELDTPTLVSPTDGASISNKYPTFHWSEVTGATDYRLEYTMDDTFASKNSIFSSETTFTPDVELSSGVWYWRVKSENAYQESDWSDVWSFTIEGTVLAAPTLISPTDGSSTRDTYPTFHWSTVAEAANYSLQYSATNPFTNIQSVTCGDTTCSPAGEIPPGVWYWRVRSENGVEASVWSDVWSFTILEGSTDDFVITVKTDNLASPDSSPDTMFVIPTTGTGYNYNVDCDSDGVDDATAQTGDYFCTYDSPGTYTILIKDNAGDGTGFPRIYFNNAGDKDKLISVDQWGTGKWVSMESAFSGCSNLVLNASDTPDLSRVTDMSTMFAGTSAFNQDISNWDVSNVTTMVGTFSSTSAFNQDISAWDVSSVTEMDWMFAAASAFNQDLSGWDVSSVTDMHNMFYYATSFNQDLSAWDVSSVTDMHFMFSWDTAFNGDLSSWDVSSVTDMGSMFSAATSFNQNLSDWDVSNVTAMNGMFSDAFAFNADISAWDVSSVSNMNAMFASAVSFNSDLSSWDVSSVTNMSYMFSGAAAFNGDLSAWDVSEVTDMSFMFYGTASFDQDLGAWDVSNVTNMNFMFYDISLSTRNYDALLNGWNAQTLQNGVTFSGGNSHYCLGEAARQNMIDSDRWSITDGGLDCSAYDDFVITVKTDNPGTSTGTQFTIPTTGSGYNYNVDCNDDDYIEAIGQTGSYTCDYGATGLNTGAGTYTIRISDNSGAGTGFPRIYFNDTGDKNKLISIDQWGTGKWTSMDNAFYGCENLISNASDAPDLSSVKDLSGMFAYASVFNHDLNNWDVSGINDMGYMFLDAGAFNGDISGWDTSNVTSMSGMFYLASDFDQDISGWDTSSVASMYQMFYRAASFDQDISGWDTSSVTDMSGMFHYSSLFDQDVSGWDVSALVTAASMFSGTTLSTENYDALLNGWDAQNLQPNVNFDGGASTYCLGETARQNMINSDGWTITDGGKNCPVTPGTPDPHFPKNNYQVTSGTSLFKWTVASDATGYQVELYTPDNELFDTLTLSDSICDTEFCQFNLPYKLEREYGSWDWRVRGTNGDLTGDWSGFATFDYVQVDPLSVTGPVDNAVVATNTPTFTWADSDQGMYQYVLEVWSLDGTRRINQSLPVSSVCSSGNCSWTSTTSLSDGTYTWRVMGKKWPNVTDWTASEIFTVNGAAWNGLNAGSAFSAPTAKFPKNNYEITAGTTILKWGPVTGAATYVVELYRPNSDWYTVWEVDASVCTATDCIFKIPTNLSFEFGSWTWRVRAKDGVSLGSWSMDAVFDYVQVDPLTLSAPLDGATVTTSTPTFTWEESDQGMYAYVIEVWSADDTRVVSQSLATGTVCTGGTCTWTSMTTLPDDDYRWHVMGKKWPNTTGWTPMEAFTVET